MKDLSCFRKNDGKLISHDGLNVFIFGGLDIDEQDDNGNTYIHLFIEKRDLDAAELFLCSGARIDIKNNEGKSCSDIIINRFKNFPSDFNKELFEISLGKLFENSCKKGVKNEKF